MAHLAAESHVDRSILGPGAFVRTNVNGTFNMLEVARKAWNRMEGKQRFLNVSTDEGTERCGMMRNPGPKSPIQPNSPYSASKAAAGHVGRAYRHTYETPVVTSHC